MSEEGLSLEDDKLLIAYRKCTLVLADDAGLLELAHRSLENTVAHRISDTFDQSETAKLLKQAYENDILVIGADPLRNTIFDFAKNIHSMRPSKLHTWES